MTSTMTTTASGLTTDRELRYRLAATMHQLRCAELYHAREMKVYADTGRWDHSTCQRHVDAALACNEGRWAIDLMLAEADHSDQPPMHCTEYIPGDPAGCARCSEAQDLHE